MTSNQLIDKVRIVKTGLEKNLTGIKHLLRRIKSHMVLQGRDSQSKRKMILRIKWK